MIYTACPSCSGRAVHQPGCALWPNGRLRKLNDCPYCEATGKSRVEDKPCIICKGTGIRNRDAEDRPDAAFAFVPARPLAEAPTEGIKPVRARYDGLVIRHSAEMERAAQLAKEAAAKDAPVAEVPPKKRGRRAKSRKRD